MTLTLSTAVHALGWSLVHFLWQGLLIATLLEVVLAALRGWSSAARYVVRCAAFAGMGLAPVVTFFVLVGADSTPRAFEPAFAVLLPALDPASSGMERAMPWVVLAWSLGSTMLGLRLWLGCRRISRLRAHARGRDLPQDTLATFERIAKRLGVRAAARVVDSVRLAAPAVVGWLRPVVIFPAHVLTGLSPDQIECLIVHELAHVRRHDFLVNVLQSVIEAALFYHPAVWWVSAGIRTEREFCCDDVALRMTRNGVSYARALTTLEAWRGAADLEPSVSILGGSLMQRVQRLIDTPDASRRSRGGIAVYALLPFLAAGTIGVTAMGWSADEPEPEPQQPAPDAEPQEAQQRWLYKEETAPDAVPTPAIATNPFDDDLAERVRAIRERIRALSKESANAELAQELEAIDRLLARHEGAAARKPGVAKQRWSTPQGETRAGLWLETTSEAPTPFDRRRNTRVQETPAAPTPSENRKDLWLERTSEAPAPSGSRYKVWTNTFKPSEVTEEHVSAPRPPAPPWTRMTWTVEWAQAPSAPPSRGGAPQGQKSNGTWRWDPGTGSGGRVNVEKFDFGKFEVDNFEFDTGEFDNFEVEVPTFDKFEVETPTFEFEFDEREWPTLDPAKIHVEWRANLDESGTWSTPQVRRKPSGEAQPDPRGSSWRGWLYDGTEAEPENAPDCEPEPEPEPEEVREPAPVSVFLSDLFTKV